MKKIKTFEDACKKLGIDPKHLPDVSMFPEIHQKAIIAHYKLVIIAQAINDGWQPDWSNRSQYKYFPWFFVEADSENKAGSGLSFDVYVNGYADSFVGSRLSFETSEQAKYAGEQFKELYAEYFLIR